MNGSIQVLDEKTARFIELDGNLDGSLSPQLEEVLSQTDLSNDQRIIINFEKVPTVTPDGVRVLLNAFIKQNAAGLSLKNPNNEVRQLFLTVGLESLIQDQ